MLCPEIIHSERDAWYARMSRTPFSPDPFSSIRNKWCNGSRVFLLYRMIIKTWPSHAHHFYEMIPSGIRNSRKANPWDPSQSNRFQSRSLSLSFLPFLPMTKPNQIKIVIRTLEVWTTQLPEKEREQRTGKREREYKSHFFPPDFYDAKTIKRFLLLPPLILWTAEPFVESTRRRPTVIRIWNKEKIEC